MTETTEREEEANPYNQNKPWHNVKETRFESADAPYFEDPQLKTEDSEEEGEPTKREARKDKPYKKTEHNWKKRYDDRSKQYNAKLQEWRDREQDLLEQLETSRPKYQAPKTPEELEGFRQKYPDVFEVVETVAHMQSEEKAKDLEDRLTALQEREKDLIRKDAEKRLRDNHPDFDDIRNSEDFHTWAKAQPESIQSWIYNNTGDADLAGRALDLFKRDMGVDSSPKKTRSNSKKSRKSAADMVSTKTTAVEPRQEKVWTEREIAAMSLDQFDKYEEDINQAVSEGRVVS